MRSTSDAAAAKQRSLDTVDDPVARRYLRVTAHADLATEPHLTNGLNGLKNFVMDMPGYVAYCAIDGGMGRLAHRLAANIPDTAIQCGARVVRIEATPDGGFRIHCASDHGRSSQNSTWCAGVSGQPGGSPVRDPVATHPPGGGRLAGLFVVGDYLFDSTLNGVARSTGLATDLLASRLPAGAATISAPVFA